MSTGTDSRRKILVVDDDPSMLVFVKRQLENAGYAVLAAEDGIVGGHLALNGSPDLLRRVMLRLIPDKGTRS